jgi:dihydropteroate synthase
MQLRCGTQLLDLARPVVMGVLNVTPDSFSDGGRFTSVAAAVEHGQLLASEGAQIIDVGGESTRPGAEPVDVHEELRRVIPVIEQLRATTSAVVSIDTQKPQVMLEAAAAGAGLINDVLALRASGALEAAASTTCAVCLMHMQGEPRTMQKNPTYSDVVSDIKAFMLERVQACRSAGISDDRIVLDPGFGFGKTAAHNLELLRRLPDLAVDGLPVLAGLSRKSMIAKLLGDSAKDRIHASVALAVIAAMQGARIIRVHDVAATVDAMKMVTAVLDGRGI